MWDTDNITSLLLLERVLQQITVRPAFQATMILRANSGLYLADEIKESTITLVLEILAES